MRAQLALAALLAAPAWADRADDRFKDGKRLLADKQYPAACAAFEEVDQLAPGIGAKLNVARCYEEWGRLATAHRWYADAEAMAQTAGDDRLLKIRELLATLDANVPRLILRVPEGARPDVIATITLDGKPVPAAQLGTAIRVDPGPRSVAWVVDGTRKTKVAPIERGSEADLTLAIPVAVARPVDPGPPPGRTQRIAGVALVAGGGVALGVATVLTLGARGRYNDALDAHCMGERDMCDATGLARTGDARDRANLATWISIGGGALIAGGVALYLLAPDGDDAERDATALRVTPVVTGHGAGLVLGGRF